MPKISAPQDCLVRMLAAPINPSDCNQVAGTYALLPSSFPAVGGNEGVGVVEEVGRGVVGLKRGDFVIPRQPSLGTWRQFLVAQEDALHRLSSRVGQDLSLEAAATLAVNPPTAAFLLRSHVHTHPPPAILQNGANSAVGRLIIQMAAQQQRRSINLIRPRPDFDALKAELERLGGGWARVLSTAAPLDELTAAVDECQPRVAFNCVGGEAASGLLCRLMPEDSEIVTYGGMSGRPLVVSAGALIFKNLRFSGFWLSRIKQRDESLMERVLKECEGMLRDGQISTAPMEHVSLEQVTNDHLKFGNGIKKLIIF